MVCTMNGARPLGAYIPNRSPEDAIDSHAMSKDGGNLSYVMKVDYYRIWVNADFQNRSIEI